MQGGQASPVKAGEAQALQEELAKVLEQLTYAARRAVARLTQSWEQENKGQKSPESEITKDDLRISAGRRVIYGETARGFRNELTPEVLQNLAQAIQQPVTEGASLEDYQNRVPRFEIKIGDTVLFRQERDGVVTANELRLERQVEQQAEVELQKPQFGLYPREWQEAYGIQGTASTLIDRFGVPCETGQNVRIGDWEIIRSEDSSLTVKENDHLVLQTDSAGEIVQADSDRFEQTVYQLSGAVLASSLEQQIQHQNEETSSVEALAQEVQNNQELSLDSDEDGLTNQEERALGSDPLSADPKRDGLSDVREMLSATDPLDRDTNNDGIGESLRHSVAYRADNLNSITPILDNNSDDLYQGFKQLLDDVYGANPNELNQDIGVNASPEAPLTEKGGTKPTSIEVKEIPPAIRVASSEVEKAPQGNARQLFKALVSELGKEAQKLSKQAVDWAVTRPEWIRDRGVATTALNLFNDNYKKTGETTYQAENYQVKLQGLNNYQISDRNGKLLMEFQKTALGGIKLRGTPHMVAPDYQQFANARQSLQQFGKDILSEDSSRRVSLLGGLAPRGDLEVINTLKTKEVMKTARNFLQNMGIQRWDAGEKGNYNIEREGNEYLRIDSKADGRGTVLLLVKGQMLTNNLGSKDFTHFRKLDQIMQKDIQAKQEKIAAKEASNFHKQQFQKRPSPKKEVGLEL